MSNENKKVIYMHIGMHKTASTSIQESLTINSKLLKKNINAYYYGKKYGLRGTKIIFDDEGLLKFLKIKDKEKIESKKKNFIKKILKQRRNKIIISDEGLLDLPKESIIELKSLFEKSLKDVKFVIIISLRDVRTYSTSRIQQEIKKGDSNINQIINDKIIPSYKTSIVNYIEVFGIENVIIYKFEDACTHEFGPTGHFLELIGVDSKDIQKFNIINMNDSLSDKAVELIYYINQKICSLEFSTKNSNINIQNVNYPLHEIRGDKFKLKKEVIDKIIERCKDDIIWLKEHLGIDYTDTESNFHKTENYMYDENYYRDIINAYPSLNLLLKKLVYDFILEKKNEVSDDLSKENLEKILEYIRNNYNKLTTLELEQVIKINSSNYMKILVYINRYYLTILNFYKSYGLKGTFNKIIIYAKGKILKSI